MKIFRASSREEMKSFESFSFPSSLKMQRSNRKARKVMIRSINHEASRKLFRRHHPDFTRSPFHIHSNVENQTRRWTCPQTIDELFVQRKWMRKINDVAIIQIDYDYRDISPAILRLIWVFSSITRSEKAAGKFPQLQHVTHHLLDEAKRKFSPNFFLDLRRWFFIGCWNWFAEVELLVLLSWGTVPKWELFLIYNMLRRAGRKRPKRLRWNVAAVWQVAGNLMKIITRKLFPYRFIKHRRASKKKTYQKNSIINSRSFYCFCPACTSCPLSFCVNKT